MGFLALHSVPLTAQSPVGVGTLPSACGTSIPENNCVRLRGIRIGSIALRTVPMAALSLVHAAYGDNTIRLWDADTGELRHTLEGHRGEVRSVAFSPDGSTIASTTVYEDNTIRLWDADTGELRHTLEGHRGEVRSVAFSPDGSTIASGSADNTIRLWDADTGKQLRGIESANEVDSVAFSPDGSTIASGDGDTYHLVGRRYQKTTAYA